MKLWREPFDRAEMATTPSKVIVDRDRCKGCGFCAEYCPTGALVMSDEMNAKGYLLPKMEGEGECLGCGLCEVLCPDFGIRVVPADGEK